MVQPLGHYAKVKEVIGHIVARKLHSQSLDELSAELGISPGHLQKLFTEWVGITPKQFGRYLSLQYSKGLLLENKNMEMAALHSGLSGSGRLHDLFVDIEAMTPGEFQGLGSGLNISYSSFDTQFGLCLVASTSRGICAVVFADTKDAAFSDLESRFPHATFSNKGMPAHAEIQDYFNKLSSASRTIDGGQGQGATLPKIKFHLCGTNFQIKVWEALLSIPEGAVSTYGSIASRLGDKKLSRAVGTAIGSNPIGFIIPCHRVLKSTGEIGGYRWGPDRKRIMLSFEAAKKNGLHDDGLAQ